MNDFITISRTHFQASSIVAFCWLDGKLHVWSGADTDPADFDDKDRSLYLSLCKDLCVEPAEEDA